MNQAIRLGASGIVAAGAMFTAGMSVASRPFFLGPPLICEEFEVGDAKTLSLTGDRSGALVSETLGLLKPETPIIVRMETIRRAVVRGAKDPGVLRELMCELQARVLDQEARGKSDGPSWFDAGFLAASWGQMDADRAPEVGLAEGCIGYAWVRKALAAGRDAPEMEFAAALVTHPAMHKGTHELYEGHLVGAAAGAAKGSLLEKNLQAHCRNWNESYEGLKKKGGAERHADGHR